MQRNFIDSFKQRWARIGLIFLLWLLALPFLLYFGYCWGWWGHSNLLLQHYFQCKCPSGSEKARYPKEVEILISPCSCPCNYHYANLSPGGRFLYSYEDKSGDVSTSLLDLETGQQRFIQSITSFVTDEIAFKENGRDGLIVDLSTGKQYPIQHFSDLQPNAYTDGKLNQQMLVDTLQQAKGVYLIEGNFRVLVLMSEFPANMQKNFTFDITDLAGYRVDVPLERFLVDNSIRYTAIPNDFPREAVSPNGIFIAREDGIYTAATDKKVVDGLPWLHVRGWVSDSSGAIYTAWWDEPCWPGSSLGAEFSSQCKLRVTQPVIKLKVPEIYRVLSRVFD